MSDVKAHRLCGVFAALLIPWEIFAAKDGFRVAHVGVVPNLLPLWSVVLAVGLCVVTVALFRGRGWAWPWAYGIALLQSVLALNWAWRLNHGGGRDFLSILEALVCVSVVIALRSRMRAFTVPSQRASVLVLAVGMVLAFYSSIPTESSRQRFASALQEASPEARVWAEGDALHVRVKGKLPRREEIAWLRPQGDQQVVVWRVGFKRVAIENGLASMTVRRPW